ncbi:hypothetical protein ACWC9U_35460 [Streptomyces sp. 900116325]
MAEALADLVVAAPGGMAPEIASPRVESLVDMARRRIAAGGVRRRPVLPLGLPGRMNSGGLLPTGPGLRGVQTFAIGSSSERQAAHTQDGRPSLR